MLLRNLLWVDCIGALAAGVLVLSFSGWLSGLYGLSQPFVVFLAAVNLAYGSFSLSLAARRKRPVALVGLLAAANAAWGFLFCFGAAIVLAPAASPFGLAHLIGEGLYVGGLGLLEWKRRHQLATAP
jgi:hypothetical protein